MVFCRTHHQVLDRRSLPTQPRPELDLPVQTPTKFEFQQINYLTLNVINQLEHELTVYRTQPQNRDQNIYLFADKYMTLNFRQWFADKLYDKYQDGDIEITPEDKLRTYDDKAVIKLLKLAMKPKDAKESVILISKIVDAELLRHKDKLKSYAWNQVVSWSSSISKVFEVLEYYLEHIQPETGSNPPHL
jgi:hypothetical protein